MTKRAWKTITCFKAANHMEERRRIRKKLPEESSYSSETYTALRRSYFPWWILWDRMLMNPLIIFNTSY
jgi:hypothetical protein